MEKPFTAEGEGSGAISLQTQMDSTPDDNFTPPEYDGLNDEMNNDQRLSKSIRKVYLTTIIPFFLLNIVEAFITYELWTSYSFGATNIGMELFYVVGVLPVVALSIALCCNQSSCSNKIFVLLMSTYILLKTIMTVVTVVADAENSMGIEPVSILWIVFSFDVPFAVVLIVDYVLYFIKDEDGILDVKNPKVAQKCVVALSFTLMPSLWCFYSFYNKEKKSFEYEYNYYHDNDYYDNDNDYYNDINQQYHGYLYQTIYCMSFGIVLSLVLIVYALKIKFQWNICAWLTKKFGYSLILIIIGLFGLGAVAAVLTIPSLLLTYIFYIPYLIAMCVAIKKMY